MNKPEFYFEAAITWLEMGGNSYNGGKKSFIIHHLEVG